MNPMAFFVEQARRVLIFGELPQWGALGIAMLVSMGIAWAGYIWFQRTRVDSLMLCSASGSSGLFARLAFSVVVHAESSVLIGNETLSTGDSMFQEKPVF